jgi:hypothetical protein
VARTVREAGFHVHPQVGVKGFRIDLGVAISLEDRTVDIKKRRDTVDVHPEAVFAHQIVDAQVLADAAAAGKIAPRSR